MRLIADAERVCGGWVFEDSLAANKFEGSQLCWRLAPVVLPAMAYMGHGSANGESL